MLMYQPMRISESGSARANITFNAALLGFVVCISGLNPTAARAAVIITGIRLEALEDPGLPGGNGPGLFPANGNFMRWNQSVGDCRVTSFLAMTN